MFDKKLHLVDVALSTHTQLSNGKWEIAKPLNGPFWMELKSRVYGSIQVLLGKAVPIRWY